ITRKRPGKTTRIVPLVISRPLMASHHDHCRHCSNFDPSYGITAVGTTSRFFRTCYKLQEYPNRLLCDLISACHLRTEFSAQPIRKLFSRTPIRSGEPEFRSMVSGTVTRVGASFSRRNLTGRRSLRRLSARTANMVDLGSYRHDYLLGNSRAYLTGLYRTAL